MMSGAISVKAGSSSRLGGAGRHARKVRDIARLLQDRQGRRRVLATLRRDLVRRSGWRRLKTARSRALRAARLVKARTRLATGSSAADQFGLRISFTRLRQPTHWSYSSARRAAVWRDSIAEHLTASKSCSADHAIDREPLDRAASFQGQLLQTIRASAADQLTSLRDRRRLALLIGSKLVGYAGLARGSASQASARRPGAIQGRLAALRWAAVEAATRLATKQPFHSYYRRWRLARKEPSEVGGRRKLLICSWHMLSRNQVFSPPTAADSSSRFLAA